MSKKIAAVIFAALFTFVLSAQSKSLVVLVAPDQTTYDKLDASDKLYARSAFQTFVGNLTLIDEITVRTDANDSSLREVQKKSQVEASKGLGSEDSAYALDMASKATLRIEISLVKYKTGYKLEYSTSNIETMQIVSGSSSSKYFELEQIDEETDLISYECIKSLYGKGYISGVPYNVEKQLTHSSDTSENYAEYILELTKQIEDCQNELDKIKKENMSAAEKAEATRKEQALQLKIQAAESAKRKTEENLRKYQEELAKKEKQQAELKALTEQKRNDLAKKFQEKIKQSQEQQSKLNKELAQSLSLEKRIELIEADRNAMEELETQLIAQLEINENDLTEKMNAEIDEINAQPWRLAEKDSSGNPTSKALKYRESQVKKVQDKYNKLIIDSGNEYKSAFAPAISTYEKQIEEGIKELEATTFVYRSFESGSHLTVTVGNYDGEKYNWSVEPDFSMKETDLITNIPDVSYFKCTVSYKDISGRNPVEYNGTNDEAYADYLDFVELSDLCFRTSTPYIYGTLSVKVKYNSVYGDYRMVFQSFSIRKMEDNQLVAEYDINDYNALLKGVAVQQVKDAKQQEKEAQELKKKQEKEQKKTEKEQERQKQHTEVQGLLGSILNYWKPNMKQKSGLSIDLGLNVLAPKNILALDVKAIIGGNSILYYGVEGTYDSFSGYDTYGCLFDLGTSVNVGCFRPYGELYAGVGYIDSSAASLNPMDLRLGTRAGMDIVIKEYGVGLFLDVGVRSESLFVANLGIETTIGVGFSYLF